MSPILIQLQEMFTLNKSFWVCICWPTYVEGCELTLIASVLAATVISYLCDMIFYKISYVYQPFCLFLWSMKHVAELFSTLFYWLHSTCSFEFLILELFPTFFRWCSSLWETEFLYVFRIAKCVMKKCVPASIVVRTFIWIVRTDIN